MTKKENSESKDWGLLLFDYIFQIGFLGLLVVVIVIVYLNYPPFWKNHWIPVLATAGGFGILTLISILTDFWRNYRWIIGSALLILLILIDISWWKSTLSTNSLEKLQSIEYFIPHSNVTLHIAYPVRILYDSENVASLKLWATNITSSRKQTITVSSENLFFAIQSPNNSSLQWKERLEVEFPSDSSALTIFLQPVSSDFETSKDVQIILTNNNTDIQAGNPPLIRLEGKQDAQRRSWINILLDTGSIIISLIVAIFAGVKQLEEDKKRKRADEIKQAIDTFDTIIINDFPKALADYLELIWDWDVWEKPMQKQFREKFSSFVDTDEFWNRLSNRSVSEIQIDVSRSLQLCAAVSINKEQLVLLKDAIQQDTHFLLTLVKKHSQSISVAKRVAKALPDERKRKIREEFTKEFQPEIIALKDELGFIEKNFPLQEQFHHYATAPHVEDKIAKWLEMRQMQYSPFLDANSPYTLLTGEKKAFIDHVSTSFVFTTSDHPISTFGFVNPWDVGAALFEYCKNLQIQPNVIDETFVVILTPTIGADYGAKETRKLILHALAEQWLWSLSEKPTMLYDLHQTPRALLGRLLRWHSGSPFAAINRIEQLIEKRTDDENTINLPRKIIEWLNNIDTTDLRIEEINSLIELRPPLKKRTMLLISSVDINPRISTQITVKQHEMLDGEAEWLDIHDWALMHFLLDGTRPQTITLQVLSNQCNLRTRKCSNEKIEAFNALFAPHDKEPADTILASKAQGSPGKMVRLGQDLLLQHVEKYPPEEDLQIDDLLDIE